MDFHEAQAKIKSLKDNLGRAIKGKPDIIDLAVVTLLSKGHLLIEDVPGVGKTTLAHGIARSISSSFQRIQFTSDLLPSDVIGVTVYNQAKGSFEFRKGPVFANIVLADEINRATPKTQSALLEAMNDRQVSVDRDTYALPDPFMLLATQNPVEFAGTYPLPESQLDRFTVCARMGYPDEAHEREIIRTLSEGSTAEGLSATLTIDDIRALQALVESVRMDDDLVGYIVAVSAATRNHRGISLGVSPRGSMTLYRTAKARALVEGRDFCMPDDIKALARPVLAHRIIPASGQAADITDLRYSLIEDALSTVSVPV